MCSKYTAKLQCCASHGLFCKHLIAPVPLLVPLFLCVTQRQCVSQQFWGNGLFPSPKKRRDASTVRGRRPSDTSSQNHQVNREVKASASWQAVQVGLAWAGVWWAVGRGLVGLWVPIEFPRISYERLMAFLWLVLEDFLWVSYGFPTDFLWISCNCLWISYVFHGFPIDFQWVSY